MTDNEAHILVVDDDVRLRSLLQRFLRESGYFVSVAKDADDARCLIQEYRFDLLIVDIMMPIMDGRQTCEAIRQIPELNDTIIVFLSAVQEEQCQIESYLAGADDYITKPVSMRILCSRVNAIMKRIKPTVTPSCSVDSARRVVITPQGELTLPRKEFEIVELLLSDPGKVFTREEIFSQIWGGEVVVGDRTLDVHIRRLRRKLGDDTITTHKGIGFKIEI